MAEPKTLEEVKKEIAEYAQRPGNTITDKTTPMSKRMVPVNGVQWDNVFDDGAMFKHGNNAYRLFKQVWK